MSDLAGGEASNFQAGVKVVTVVAKATIAKASQNETFIT